MLDNLNFNRPEPEIIESTLSANAKPWQQAVDAKGEITDYVTRAAVAETRVEHIHEFSSMCANLGQLSRMDRDVAMSMAQGFVGVRSQEVQLEMYRVTRATQVQLTAVASIIGCIGAVGMIFALGTLLTH